MTVVVKLGRRVPKSLKSRIINKVKGFIGFQENIWIMMKMSFEMAQRKFKSGTEKPKGYMELYHVDRKVEPEDTFWNLEWLTITVKGDKECEETEFTEAQNMYKDLKNVLKKMPKDGSDEKLKSVFKTKMLSPEKLKDAYTKGYGSEKNKNISNILLEMGIITHIEWIKDYDERNKKSGL